MLLWLRHWKPLTTRLQRAKRDSGNSLNASWTWKRLRTTNWRKRLRTVSPVKVRRLTTCRHRHNNTGITKAAVYTAAFLDRFFVILLRYRAALPSLASEARAPPGCQRQEA